MRVTKMVAVLLGLLFIPVVALHAQTAVGEVNGTVTDRSGGLIAEAAVTLTNEATKIETARSTGGSGEFVFVNVRPGRYILRVKKQGFKEIAVAAFEVGVNDAV